MGAEFWCRICDAKFVWYQKCMGAEFDGCLVVWKPSIHVALTTRFSFTYQLILTHYLFIDYELKMMYLIQKCKFFNYIIGKTNK